ncbi:hypothetical protein K438DRAFT_1563231, partial [Mycena galopus ATCC 62051]
LVGNTIMFSTPVAKVYNVLPLSQDELSEVLAFVFLGSAKPTDEDFARTPMLVRRRRVQDTLNWLKLNHKDYDCLTISKDNFEALPENGIPCGVNWKQTDPNSSNLVPESLSVDNSGEEDEGMSSGRCSFSVAGLTGEQYYLNDMRPLKIRALDHLKRGGNFGKTLGVGHSEEPESMFHNIQLYPQMFPWLFPYGLGAIGHPSHKLKLSADAHKK